MEAMLYLLEGVHVVVQYKMTALKPVTLRLKMQIPIMKGCGF